MSGLLPQHGEILLYDNGADKQFVSVVFKDETFWLTQSGMAELFDCSADNISLHLKNIYADGELEQAATTEKFSVVRKEGSREVRRSIDHYDLDAIIAVGYRVNSKKATHFRQWATKTLKEYIQKGFVLNDELMKNGRPFGKDYFDELLERIREIRASERRAYQKIADVFEQSGGFCAEPKKVLYGGPMMGIAVPDLDQPVLKNTNAVLAMTEADAVLPEPTACIRCGRCIRHCPLRLMPSHIVAAYEAGNMERLAELKVNLCMECGCCSFGCPAHRPLVQTNKLAKAKLAAWRKAQSEKLDAKKEAVK